MKRFLIFFIAAIITSTFIESCKRYEDGPLISCRSVENRVDGNWNVEFYFVNDVDSTISYNDSCGCEISIHFDYDRQDFVLGSCKKNCSGSFSLSDNNTMLNVTMSHFENGIGGPFYTLETVNWKILRLAKDELWIETNFNSKIYFVKLNKQL
ncbi:MAG: hypothetical protein V2A54_05800 [Bacteroidota bacterium]